ncbi:hypothetical protein N0V82_007564 [Gnomoniopsis sp. IMI 355080]|nr:hypothetical protein N0V82_007564 [Gnomoniopsis sp. IMI 355080]
MLRISLALILTALPLFHGAVLKDFESPPYTDLFAIPLPISPIKEPKFNTTDPLTGRPINYYEIEIKSFSKNFYPDLGNATLVGYDGLSPGPTFVMERGVQSIVRFINNAELPNSVHLHGSYSKSAWDGWADDITQPGQFKDYFYPNNQSARTLWYHDHAADITSVNAYFGQFGTYIIHDPEEDALNLPSGEFDIPLMIGTKQFNTDGTLFNPADETTSLYGDIVAVNGEPWPFLAVQPRKYRFRLINVGDSRSFQYYFTDADSSANVKNKRDTFKDDPVNQLPFYVIGSDTGLLTNPVLTTTLYHSIAERYEVVFDFSPFAGQNITLRNTGDVAADTDYRFTDRVMQFQVSSEPVTDTSVLPSTLREIDFPNVANKSIASPDHTFTFERKNGDWRINGIGWDMVDQRVLARPPVGATEIWELVNGGGGWSHPIHVHLVDMHVIARTGGNMGRGVEPYEDKGLKDVVWLGPSETVFVEAEYQPWDGLYMFHCHNLIHEDHDMLAAFNVTELVELGYNDTIFLDPRQEIFAAEANTPEKLTETAIMDKIDFLASLQPYADIAERQERLKEFYAEHPEEEFVDED